MVIWPNGQYHNVHAFEYQALQWYINDHGDRKGTWKKNLSDLRWLSWSLRVARNRKLEVHSWHPALSKCIIPLAFSICSVYMHVCSHTGAMKTQLKCISWLPCQNKHNRYQIQCTSIIYIIFERKAVLQLQKNGYLLMLHLLLQVPGTTSSI